MSEVLWFLVRVGSAIGMVWIAQKVIQAKERAEKTLAPSESDD